MICMLNYVGRREFISANYLKASKIKQDGLVNRYGVGDE